MKKTEIPEDLIRFVQVLMEDEKLKVWFMSLENMPKNLRLSELHKMTIKMKSGNVDPTIISLVEALMETDIYEAILKTVKHL